MSPYLINPEKPPNAIDKRPATTKRIGVPFKNAGTGETLILSRIPDIKTIASKKPSLAMILLQPKMGLEPTTYALRMRRSTN